MVQTGSGHARLLHACICQEGIQFDFCDQTIECKIDMQNSAPDAAIVGQYLPQPGQHIAPCLTEDKCLTMLNQTCLMVQA